METCQTKELKKQQKSKYGKSVMANIKMQPIGA
jgi:hypothetical protein